MFSVFVAKIDKMENEENRFVINTNRSTIQLRDKKRFHLKQNDFCRRSVARGGEFDDRMSFPFDESEERMCIKEKEFDIFLFVFEQIHSGAVRTGTIMQTRGTSEIIGERIKEEANGDMKNSPRRLMQDR